MMKKTMLVLALVVSTLSFAQTSSEHEVVGTSEVIQKNPDLQVLADKVNVSYENYQRSLTGSRTSFNEATTAYTEALDTYITALEREIASAEGEAKTALEQEISKAKGMKPSSNNTVNEKGK